MKLRMMTVALCIVGCGEVTPAEGQRSTSPVNQSRSRLECPASPGSALLTNAVCVCRDYQAVGQGITTRAAAGQSADVGINGAIDVVGQFNVAGSLRAHQGLSGVGQVMVRDDVVTFGSMQGVGSASVGRDLQIAGDLSNVGQLTVGGGLFVGGSVSQVGMPNTLTPSAFTLADELPCHCDAFDVAATVASAAADPRNQRLDDVQSVGQSTLELSTGSYVLRSFDSVGQSEIAIRGAVALYVESGVNLVGQTLFDVPSGSTLDLYVAGDFAAVGASLFKSPPQPGAVRLYVGQNFSLVGQQELALSLYAPNANVEWVGDTTIQGSVLVGSLSTVGAFDVDYAAPSSADPQFCETTPEGEANDGGLDSDGGTETANTPEGTPGDAGAPFVEGIN